jgi:hypothetical protein
VRAQGGWGLLTTPVIKISFSSQQSAPPRQNMSLRHDGDGGTGRGLSTIFRAHDSGGVPHARARAALERSPATSSSRVATRAATATATTAARVLRLPEAGPVPSGFRSIDSDTGRRCERNRGLGSAWWAGRPGCFAAAVLTGHGRRRLQLEA